MSVCRDEYVIFGFDLSQHYQEIMGWMDETDEGRSCYEELVQKRTIGKWGIFPYNSSGEYLYLGILLGRGDEFEGFNKPVIVDPDQINSVLNTDVPEALIEKLKEVLKDTHMSEQYKIKIIVFSDWY